MKQKCDTKLKMDSEIFRLLQKGSHSFQKMRDINSGFKSLKYQATVFGNRDDGEGFLCGNSCWYFCHETVLIITQAHIHIQNY